MPAGRAPVASTPARAEVRLSVDGLTCEGCAWQIREKLEAQPGVEAVSTSVSDKLVAVTIDAGRTTPEQVRAALVSIGYEAAVVP